MELYSLFTAICLALMVLECVHVVTNLIRKPHKDRIAFLRSFKKGKCAFIYVTAIPLYCMGQMYTGQNPVNAFFNAVNKCINLVVLKYETSSISKLMEDNALFRYTIYFCFILVGLNALIFSISLVGQNVWAWYRRRRFYDPSREKLLLFGYNPENLDIYSSDRERSKIICDDLSADEKAKLYSRKIAYASLRSEEVSVEKISKILSRKSQRMTVVVNTKNDERNLSICKKLLVPIGELAAKDPEAFLRFQVLVFGDPRYETIYFDLVQSACGCIRYVNKYHMVATQYIDEYPLTRFMDERQLDYKTSLVKPGVDINVLFIGFGKTNQQIFLSSVANNQFLTSVEGTEVLKQVNYHIFDKEHSENNKNLNHNYYRFRNEVEGQADSYLALPAMPARETYHVLDVNDHTFYQKIRELITRSALDANTVIIAFGTDLENIDMAQKLVEKRAEWGVPELQIFVKARHRKKEHTLLENAGCHFIGYEKEAVYSIDRLLYDRIITMARSRNQLYDLENYIAGVNSSPSQQEIAQCLARSTENWFVTKTHLDRQSSLYCCLSLRSKLHLMGLDYCSADDSSRQGLTEQEYLAHYAGDDLPEYLEDRMGIHGKPIVRYSLPFRTSRRSTMAVQEHYRWNSYMISKGFIPARKELILKEQVTVNGKTKYTNGKSYALRRHGNLTTMAGLVEFRNMLVQRDGSTPIDADVIKYDYQILDDAYWLLAENGYKIVKKQ